MATFAVSPTLIKAGKWILRRAVDESPVVGAFIWAALDDDAESPVDIGWTRWHTRWIKATPAGLLEDKGEFKLDVVNITAGDVDATWTTPDLTTVNNAIYALETALLPYMSPSQSFYEIAAYRMRFNHAMDPAHPFLPTGPPLMYNQSTRAGTGTGVQAYQVAGSVTFKTPSPKHWGRAYLPTPGTNSLDTNGRFTSTYRSGVSAAFDALFDTLAAADFYVNIPMTRFNKVPFHALQGVQQIQVDDVPDVQRRRRPKTTGARTIVTP